MINGTIHHARSIEVSVHRFAPEPDVPSFDTVNVLFHGRDDALEVKLFCEYGGAKQIMRDLIAQLEAAIDAL